MNEKQASIYLRVIWLNDNDNLRPSSLNIKLDGENTEDVVFSISQNDNNIGNNSLWENVTEWANGITYNYQKIIENEDNSQPQEENSPKTEEINEIKENNIPYVIPSVINIPNNYRCNILKNAETETYSYYTIKMTYIPPKPRKMLRSASSTTTLNFNGTTIENVNFNGTKVEKVVFNGTTVFEKKKADFASLILANSTLNEGTPDFSLTATTDEGMFAAEDNDGISYYFRGAVTNNYVKFGGFCWRIIRINGDGTIRLIYDGTTCHANGTTTSDSVARLSQKYNLSSDNSSYVGWTYALGSQRPTNNITGTSSNAKTQLENWYSSNLASYTSKIADGKFCNDRDLKSGNIWDATNNNHYYAAKGRMESKVPTLACNSGDIYTLKVGLITMDEVMYAGGTEAKNTLYYLYNGKSYWTMSPSYRTSFGAGVFYNSNTAIANVSVSSDNIGLRPVVNICGDLQVTGTGTMEEPYVVVGDE